LGLLAGGGKQLFQLSFVEPNSFAFRTDINQHAPTLNLLHVYVT
jgi:hypothetical protein